VYCDVGQGESVMRDPFALKFPGAIYHLTSRGSARQKVFSDARSRVENCSSRSNAALRSRRPPASLR
jgi:hypothetical protein